MRADGGARLLLADPDGHAGDGQHRFNSDGRGKVRAECRVFVEPPDIPCGWGAGSRLHSSQWRPHLNAFAKGQVGNDPPCGRCRIGVDDE